jgi:hypothetical protein
MVREVFPKDRRIILRMVFILNEGYYLLKTGTLNTCESQYQ